MKKLNREQKEAVSFPQGPLMIIAGAGTGKTTVIAERIKWLISQNLAKPEEILALTFTEKAASEMEERVDQLLPYGYIQMWISTFHSFGEKVLRQEAVQIGLDPGYKLMTLAESVIFLRKNLFLFNLDYFRPLGNPNKFIEGILHHFHRLKDEDVSPSQYLHWVESQAKQIRVGKKEKEEMIELEKYRELAFAYQKYEELKVKEGLMDFADLIGNTLLLFRQRKNVLKEYQERFKYILVDEFQDTNFAQNELAILLAGEKKNLTVVGDDDQAIYRWRGAAISNLVQFRQRFPEAKIIVLRKNYRSTEEILRSSYRLIQFNNPDRLEVKENITKKLLAQRKIRGKKIEFIFTARGEEEAEEVVKKIKTLKKKNPYQWRDFAILVRANSQAEPFVKALQREGIPYQFLGPGMLFRQEEIKDLIAYLRLLNNVFDSVAFYRVLAMPIFRLPPRDLVVINHFAQLVNLSIFEAVEVIVADYQGKTSFVPPKGNYKNYLPHLSEKTKEILTNFLSMVERHLKLSVKETAGQILYYFLSDTGLLSRLADYRTLKEERAALNIAKFFERLRAFETEHEDARVKSVVEWIDIALELGESPLAADFDWEENNAVNILTLHSAKGLEFPVVFLVNLVAGRFPTYERREAIPLPQELVKEILPEGDYHLEEERRLFYVGMTRARDFLFFSAANYYGEGKRERKISPFVFEALGERKLSPKKTGKKLRRDFGFPQEKERQKEENFLRQGVPYLSYSQLETFATCPLQYKYRYLLKIPVPQSAAASFGTSVHLALQRFYEKIKKEENLKKEDLLKIFSEVWLPIGYGTKQYEEKMFTRGKKMLILFYERFFQPQVKPLYLEQLFKIQLTKNLKIGGKIDRIDLTQEGKLEVIDYKTGRRPEDKEIKESLQMAVYGLAATDPGLYQRKAEEVVLSFYFLSEGEKFSFTKTKEELKKDKEKLVEKAQEIFQSSFPPKPGKWCDFCDFKLICQAWR